MAQNRHIMSRMPLSICLLVFIFFGTAMAAQNPSNHTAELVVWAHQQVEINKDIMFLKDVAHIRGGSAQWVERLSAVELGPAPPPGQSKWLDLDSIRIRLRQNRIDTKQVVFEGAERIRVRRGAVEVAKNEIERIVLDYFKRHLPFDGHKTRIKEIKVHEPVVLPKGKISYRILPPADNHWWGKSQFAVLFKVDGRDYKKCWVQTTVESMTNVVVTRRPLGRHKPIRQEDVGIEQMDLADLPHTVITSIDQVIGKRACRKIDAKTVLRTELVESPPLVNRGDLVSIVYQNAGLKITARGEVRKKGRAGDRIRVVNLDSKKIIYARVRDSKTVLVEF